MRMFQVLWIDCLNNHFTLFSHQEFNYTFVSDSFQDAFRFPTNISIATGIGITPFLATIRDLKNYEKRTTKDTFKLKKFHLIWVCRSIKEFIWILDEIDGVEQIVSDVLRIMHNISFSQRPSERVTLNRQNPKSKIQQLMSTLLSDKLWCLVKKL